MIPETFLLIKTLGKKFIDYVCDENNEVELEHAYFTPEMFVRLDESFGEKQEYRINHLHMISINLLPFNTLRHSFKSQTKKMLESKLLS